MAKSEDKPKAGVLAATDLAPEELNVLTAPDAVPASMPEIPMSYPAHLYHQSYFKEDVATGTRTYPARLVNNAAEHQALEAARPGWVLSPLAFGHETHPSKVSAPEPTTDNLPGTPV